MKYTTLARLRADGTVERMKVPSFICEYELANKYYHSDWCRLNGKDETKDWQVFLRPKQEFTFLWRDYANHSNPLKTPTASEIFKTLEMNNFGR